MIKSAPQPDYVIIAIVSYGRPQDIMACLSSLDGSDFSHFQVVIVENAGADAFDRLQTAVAERWRGIPPQDTNGTSAAIAANAGKAAPRSAQFSLDNGQPVTLIEANENLGTLAA